MVQYSVEPYRVCIVKQIPKGSLVVKNLPVSAGDVRDAGSVPGLRRSPEKGMADPLQYSCLGNAVGRGAWRARVHWVK